MTSKNVSFSVYFKYLISVGQPVKILKILVDLLFPDILLTRAPWKRVIPILDKAQWSLRWLWFHLFGPCLDRPCSSLVVFENYIWESLDGSSIGICVTSLNFTANAFLRFISSIARLIITHMEDVFLLHCVQKLRHIQTIAAKTCPQSPYCNGLLNSAWSV